MNTYNPFPTSIADIEARIQHIDPVKYASSRNFKDGALTYLSPYISRGVISTKQVFDYIKSLELPWNATEKLVQELAWRDYWQQVWIAKGDQIEGDLKNNQTPVSNFEIPEAILKAETNIRVVDNAIKQLYETGYMHNHMRMYVASICCNIAQSHWLQPAKWMYSHLLDGDLASNYLSWQWVAGAFSNKKYYANQQNINKYFNSDQTGTMLDVEYDEFEQMPIPESLLKSAPFTEETVLPGSDSVVLDRNKTTVIYNYYNIDPNWYASKDVQRVLLLEPSFFKKYPVSKKCLDFVLELAKNIEGMIFFSGEFQELESQVSSSLLIYKEHPTNTHYTGSQKPRDWMAGTSGYFPSFFAFWKKYKKELKSNY
ncbi:MAG: FAD-binding domain-containing protein [Balneolaceae bacterium]